MRKEEIFRQLLRTLSLGVGSVLLLLIFQNCGTGSNLTNSQMPSLLGDFEAWEHHPYGNKDFHKKKYSPPNIVKKLNLHCELLGNTHFQGITETNLETHVKNFCIGDLNKVRFVHGKDRRFQVRGLGDLRAITETDKNYFQVIDSVVFRKNVFTIIVPPNWNPNTFNNVPTLISSINDLSAAFLNPTDPEMFPLLAEAFYSEGKSGFGIIWNGSGDSKTMSENSMKELNAFLTIFLAELNVASNKFIAFGDARGGATALNIAGSPQINSVSVAYVHSTVPASEFNHVSRHSGAVSHENINGLGPRHSQKNVLIGNSEESQMSSYYNLLTPFRVSNLKLSNTQILLEISAQDVIVPSLDHLRLFENAVGHDLNIEVCINNQISQASESQLRYQSLKNATISLLNSLPSQNLKLVTKHKVSHFLAQQ